jgi:hypothetical protein
VLGFIGSALQVAIAFSAGLTAYRLRQTDLQRRYPLLFIYIMWQAVYSLSPVVLNTARPA